MDFNLNEPEKMLQNMARDFAVKEIAPRAAEIDRANKFPAELAVEMGRRGLQGLPFPPEYGGSGAGYMGFVLALEQICRVSVSAGAILSVSVTPAEGIFRFGTGEQKKRLLTPLAQGQWLGGIGFTESETGSNPRLITTMARRRGDGFYITGQKMFLSNAPALNAVILFTRREGEGLNAFIVESAQPGFQVQEVLETLGIRGIGASVVNLDEVFVPAANLLGKEGQGFEILLEAISVERMSVATQAVAAAQAALELAIVYARERKALGQPLTKMQTIQQMLAEMASKIEAARWLVYRTAFLRDQGKNIQYEASMAKLFASQAAVDVTRMAMQVHGAFGAMKSLPVERLYRDAKMTEIYVGISEVHRSIIANKLIQG